MKRNIETVRDEKKNCCRLTISIFAGSSGSGKTPSIFFFRKSPLENITRRGAQTKYKRALSSSKRSPNTHICSEADGNGMLPHWIGCCDSSPPSQWLSRAETSCMSKIPEAAPAFTTWSYARFWLQVVRLPKCNTFSFSSSRRPTA
jgi:hypothetical protein